MKPEKVTIKKIVNGGYGLAHLPSGKIVLVEQALPGETLSIVSRQVKNTHCHATIREIMIPHDSRCHPPCPFHDRCGGCDFQHCKPQFQAQLKTAIIADLLSRSNDPVLQQAQSLLQKTIPSPRSFGYRQRIRLQVFDGDKLGFRRFKSHAPVEINRCLLAAEPLNHVLKNLHQLPHFRSLAEHSSELELQLNPENRKVVAIFRFTRKPRPADINNARTVCTQLEALERIFFSGDQFQLTGPFAADRKQEILLGNSLHICYRLNNTSREPFKLQWEIGGFFQVNPGQNQTLINLVLQYSGVDTADTILDLFCGMGNFSIPLGQKARSITGIEGQGSAIRSARANSRNNGLTNTVFTKQPVHEACRHLVMEGRQFDCLIIDPPRRGIPGLAGEIAALTRKRLIYISCDPATLCRDLTELCRTGFTVNLIQPVDMFPQTHHIETVAVLEK
ncbi:23S rRNA (uracil(1939)-C(5))-methyltransferase RlmD [Desulfomarina sp.]